MNKSTIKNAPNPTSSGSGEGKHDLIDRQAALDAITDELMPSTPLSAVIRAKNRLKELPSAQPERKRGKWIPFDIPWYRCSECGAERENIAFMEYFCPNCGADMRGGEMI